MVDTVLARIFAILQAHDMVGGTPVPAGPLDMPPPLPTLEEAESLLGVLGEWMPKRITFYDTEYIYEPDAYANLVQLHADATLGEWRPQQLTSEFVAGAEPGSDNAAITFVHEGERITWTFEQNTKWVRSESWDALEEFAAEHLRGTFVQLPTFDQCACFLYTPHAAAEQLNPYIEACEQVERDARRARSGRGW